MDSSKKNRTANTGQSSKKMSKKKTKSNDSDSSLSSLGSLPDISSVTKHFSDDFSHLLTPKPSFSSSSRSNTNPSREIGSSSMHRSETKKSRSDHSRNSESDMNTANRTCPHCRRVFVNSWAVPKHVIVSNSSSTLMAPTTNNKLSEIRKTISILS